MVAANGTRPNGNSVTNGHVKGLSNGGVDGPGGSKPSTRQLMHIDDAVRITVDFDPNWPIDKILNHADECLKRAESLKSFNRIDLALKEYMKAYTTTVDVIPRNKGWTTLISDRKGSKTKYNSIMARLDALEATFEKIKETIKEDNARTGVQPLAAQRRTTSEESEPDVRQAKAQVNGARPPTQSPHKPKPPVQPKPRALQSTAIQKSKPTGARVASSKFPPDLAERFASLRNATDTPGKNPLSLEHMIPSLPAVPAAIYSPARGTVSSHAAELPTSNHRGMFSRSSSTASFTKPPSSGGDYFTSPPPPTKRARPDLPVGDSVTVQELLGLMQTGSRDLHLLIIDVRNREEFDEGHILSQATICIEPDILQRENIAAAQIADAMIVAPPSEIRHFERRHEFDLIVFYDQDSDIMPTRAGSEAENALLALYNALTMFDYETVHEGELRRPKLLKGGVDAWINEVGPGSLQTSSTVGNGVARSSQKPTGLRPMTRAAGKRRISTIQDADEARSWENHVKSENSALVRTTEDFLRRFPPVSAIQESMMSPVIQAESPYSSIPAAARAAYSPEFPSPPARPPPAVPRHSHSGLPDDMDTDFRPLAKMASSKVSTGSLKRKRTGLYNPNVWCYANSTLQVLFRSGAFSDEIVGGELVNNWPVPRKEGEKINNPQLLSKIMGSLFHWMQFGNFDAMKAKTFMEYVAHIHRKDPDGIARNSFFGGQEQQDSQDFLMFLMEHLHDETNTKRDQKGQVEPNYTLKTTNPSEVLSQAKVHWSDYQKSNNSIIDKYWRSTMASKRTCKCGYGTVTFATHETNVLALPIGVRETTLEALLDSAHREELREDYICDMCKKVGTTLATDRYGRLPERLCFVLSRFIADGNGGTKKNDMTVRVPITDLDMAPYTLMKAAGPQHTKSTVDDPGFAGPFIYDLYGAVMQAGSMTGGHYRAKIQDDPQGGTSSSSEWVLFNDDRVSPVRNDLATELARDSGNFTPYVLFYRRRDAR